MVIINLRHDILASPLDDCPCGWYLKVSRLATSFSEWQQFVYSIIGWENVEMAKAHGPLARKLIEEFGTEFTNKLELFCWDG